MDHIIKTLNIADHVDNKQADSDIKSTLDTIVVKVPALPAESGDHNVEEPQETQTTQLLTPEATPTPEPKNTPDNTQEPECTNQTSKSTDNNTET